MTKLETEIRELLETEGVVVLEMSARTSAGTMQIRLIADRKVGGITIDDCVRLSRQIQYLIAEKQIINDNYKLEVSSPGLDYPLRERWQFEKNMGRLLKIRVPGEKGPRELSGRLSALTDDGFTLSGDKQEWNPTFAECQSAVVLPEFKTPATGAPAKHPKAAAKETQR
jgi:ribosome maturation factor RimP